MYKGVCGGSASGKTTVAKRIIKALDIQWVSLLSMDSFYKVIIILCMNSLKVIIYFVDKLKFIEMKIVCCSIFF